MPHTTNPKQQDITSTPPLNPWITQLMDIYQHLMPLKPLEFRIPPSTPPLRTPLTIDKKLISVNYAIRGVSNVLDQPTSSARNALMDISNGSTIQFVNNTVLWDNTSSMWSCRLQTSCAVRLSVPFAITGALPVSTITTTAPAANSSEMPTRPIFIEVLRSTQLA